MSKRKIDIEKIDLEDVPDIIKPFFKAMKNGTLHQYYLGRFRRKRDNYSDELPDEFVHEGHKCRGNYIFGLVGDLERAVDYEVITDSEIIEKIHAFKAHDFRYHHAEFTTQEEIDMINGILEDVIGYLEGKAP